jgi:hypothetical protein
MQYSPTFRNIVNLIRAHGDQVAAVVVHINDTYLLDERRSRQLPGFPRLIATVRVLRRHVLEATGEPRLLFLHSGDFLGPSRIGCRDKGRTMVQLLNRGGLNYCVLGNHEFDHGQGELIGRLGEAHFKVLAGNATPPGSIPIPYQQFALWPSGKWPSVALTGIISKSVHESFKGWNLTDPATSLKQFEENTRHVPFRIVLTHALREEDRAIRKVLRDTQRCIVLGGHDHDIDWIEADQTPPLYKNLSNLESIRVFVLLAGGDAAMIALNGSYRAMKKRLGREPPYTTENVDDLLKPILPRDADFFRRFIDGKRWTPKVAPVDLGYFTDDEDQPILPDALVRKLVGLSWIKDFLPYRLSYRDFIQPARGDNTFVRSRLATLGKHDKKGVIRDFSKQQVKFLDARDSELRVRPTGFGAFVAECVRREAKADVAILNSGSFRCDAKLPSKLRERDLRDTFLYDDFLESNRDDRAVLVLSIPAEQVDALITFGRGNVDSGAYPQVADRRSNANELKLAISGYVLLDDGSLDQYLGALARTVSRSLAETREYVRERIVDRVTIVNAILNHGQNVNYEEPHATLGPNDDASVFIALARKASLAFAKGPGRRYRTHVGWNNAFCEGLGSDQPISDKVFQAARDELRTFLRHLLGANGAAIRRGQLLMLYAAIETHKIKFRDGLAYHSMLKPASLGMSDWRPD